MMFVTDSVASGCVPNSAAAKNAGQSRWISTNTVK
jgi:hypothetical protein